MSIRTRLIDRLKQRGCAILGEGHFSTVFTHPTNPRLVIKVGRVINDGWYDYAALCMLPRWKKNPFVPRIKLLKAINDVVTGGRDQRDLDDKPCSTFYVAVMERLDRTCRLNVPEEMDAIHRLSAFLHGHDKYDRQNGVKRNYDIPQPLLDLVAVIRAAFDRGMDLHSANAMFRGAQLVITDPVCIAANEDTRPTTRAKRKYAA